MNAILMERIRKMPPEHQREVEDFIMFLAERGSAERHPCRRLRQDWAGGLREFRHRFTSLELQKLTSQWRDA